MVVCSVLLFGAGGAGGAATASGGGGGLTVGLIAVTPGDELRVIVGGGGQRIRASDRVRQEHPSLG